MTKILVTGLINIETTLRVEQFPIHYHPVRYPFWGVHTTASGVGYNVAKALHTLGDEVALAALIGRDGMGRFAEDALAADGIPAASVRADLAETPQSVILYDGEGRRQINVDLKDIQERSYPFDAFERALEGSALAVVCNINFARPFLDVARERGIPLATDVHAIEDLEDDYNRDYMAAADILFMSDERLPTSPEAWAEAVMARYQPKVLVIGLGGAGALLMERGQQHGTRLPAVPTREVVNTIGAGDALFSAFVHFYAQVHNAHAALRKAMVFASYKIGEKGAAEGFLTESELDVWLRRLR